MSEDLTVDPTRGTDPAVGALFDGYDPHRAWDEMLAANTPASVSYVLQQPDWLKIGNRWNRTFTLKTVVTVGGVDRSVNKDVTLTAPTVISQPVKT